MFLTISARFYSFRSLKIGTIFLSFYRANACNTWPYIGVISASNMGMKALPKKRLPLILFGIAVTLLFFVQPAQAFTITLEQVGANVVANGSGAINLTGLTPAGGAAIGGGGIEASAGQIITGSPGSATAYTGLNGPTSFGSGGLFNASTSSGDLFGRFPTQFGGPLFVPLLYTSGDPLTNSMTFDNATFASLGVTPGTYEWTWGTGLRNQNFTLIIGGAGVPDSGSTVSLLGCGLLGLAALRRKFS